MTREEAITELRNMRDGMPADTCADWIEALDMAIEALQQPPSDDWEQYSDRLWKEAYERGKAEAQKTGKWIPVEGWDGDEYYECSECHTEFVLIDGTPKDNGYYYCPSCGAKMKGEDNEAN